VYDSYKFIDYSRKFNFNFKNKHDLYPHRILSLHYNISELSKCILDSKKDYDFVVLTRYDILSEIINLNDTSRFKEKNVIFIWRDANDCTTAEDRLIVSSILGLEKLSFLYDDYEKLSITEDDQYPEKILGMQLNLYNDLIKKEQNIHMNLSPYKDLKYSKEVDIKSFELLDSYNFSR